MGSYHVRPEAENYCLYAVHANANSHHIRQSVRFWMRNTFLPKFEQFCYVPLPENRRQFLEVKSQEGGGIAQPIGLGQNNVSLFYSFELYALNLGL